MIRLFLATHLFLLLAGRGLSQPAKKEITEKELLNVYASQIARGLSSRGMPPLEIDKYLSQGKSAGATMKDFAESLTRLYPYATWSSTAVLFYIFNNGILYRYFIEPGTVKEEKKITISAKALQQLNTDVYSALQVYSLTANRAPKNRGGQPVSTQSNPRMPLDAALRKARDILLPVVFDRKYKHLIIIPAYSIGAFPFHLLKPYRDNSSLIEHCSFSVAPGLADLVGIRERMINLHKAAFDSTRFDFGRTLFVCNPEFPVQSDFIFPALPGTRKEIDSTLRYVKDYLLFEGKDATKQHVLENILNCNVAYFATHGMSSEINPMDNNFLVLCGEKDPYLTARDIFALRNNIKGGKAYFPELVVLSACQTGLGKSMEAGIYGGMARSFLIAGANQVIMSLWSVDDEATAYLMNRFVFHLQSPHLFVPAEPLRLAMLDTREKFPDPAYWAGFSVYGVNK